MSTDAAAPHAHGSLEQLARMANDIGAFFAAEPDREQALAGIANHIQKFWTPRMRQKILEHLKDAALDPLPRQALERVRAGGGQTAA